MPQPNLERRPGRPQESPKACKIMYISRKCPLKSMIQVCSRINLFLSISCLVLGALPALAQQSQTAPTPPPNPPAENPTTPRIQTKPGQPTTPGTPSPGGAPVDSSKYKVGPADVLLIRVWNEPEFTGPVAVHEDGKFTLPLVGDLDAGGKTPIEIQDEVAKALTKYVVRPLVTVTVQDVGSKRYYIDGLAARPGVYSLVVPTTVLEAISAAGGLQEFANEKKIYVLRGSKQIPFNYKDVLKGKHMEQNILLQPDDHIVVR